MTSSRTTAPERNPLGTTGHNVRHNVRRLREAQGLTKKDLSERTTFLGRPIPPLGISRLEAGTRRVDVDDLVILAGILRVEPMDLFTDAPFCRACHGEPPVGFSCNQCGSSAREALTRPDGSDPESFYRRVAEAYAAAACKTSAPARVLAEEADVPVATVRRWINEARRRGVLAPTSQGKIGTDETSQPDPDAENHGGDLDQL